MSTKLLLLFVVLALHGACSRVLQADAPQPVVPPGCPPPIAFLQKTHKVTLRFLDSALRAKQQVQERCGGYHRVLYAVHEDLSKGDKKTLARAVQADLNTLRAALGEDGVIAFGPQDFSTTFGIEWGKSPLHGKFSHNHCDAPELVWYDLFGRDLDPAIKHVWTAEYDVAWTGDIAGVFATFPERPDFICSTDYLNGIKISSSWPNYNKRTWLKNGEVRMCFIMLARYSMRYMRVFWEETRMGHQQFCEVSGAAICTKHSMWCQIHTFNQDSDVVGRDVKGGPMYRFNNSIDPQKWGELTVVNAAGARQAPPATLQVGNNTGNATALAAFNRTLNLMPGHIFHAVKW